METDAPAGQYLPAGVVVNVHVVFVEEFGQKDPAGHCVATDTVHVCPLGHATPVEVLVPAGQ